MSCFLKLPCEDCITFVMCKNRYNKLSHPSATARDRRRFVMSYCQIIESYFNEIEISIYSLKTDKFHSVFSDCNGKKE